MNECNSVNFRFEKECDRYTYIDVWEGGKFRSYNELYHNLSANDRNPEFLKAVRQKQVRKVLQLVEKL